MAGAGDYNTLVTLVEPVQAVYDDGEPMTNAVGEPVINWTSRVQVWASIQPLAAREFEAASQQQSASTYQISMRVLAGIYLAELSTWRIECGGEVYRVTGTLPSKDRLSWVLTAEVASYEQSSNRP
jgi:SPP1 family predicted phage head-tail adaptor